MFTKLWRRLWQDQRGETNSLGLVLVTTIVAFGVLTGVATLREQIVQEFGDLALAIENLNQSYTGPFATFTDPGPFPSDTANAAPACLNMQIAP